MNLRNKTTYLLLTICTTLFLCSCKKGAEKADAVYNITDETSSVYIDDWHVLGSFTQRQDSLQGKKLFANPEKCQLTVNPDRAIKLWKNGITGKMREDNGVPFTLTLRRNTRQGQYGYHRLVVGRDALEYFRDKTRAKSKGKHYTFPQRDTTVADFYSKPFIYVYNSADKSAVYKQLVDSIRNEYETYLYAKLPLMADTKVTPRMLEEKNVFLIGEHFTNRHVREYARQ